MDRECALLARAILEAARQGDAAALETLLAAAAAPAGGGERLELLHAVARQMRGALVRMRHGLSERWEGGEVCLALLEHLAAEPSCD